MEFSVKKKPCWCCGTRPKFVTIRKYGEPSGDLGYETTIWCPMCDCFRISWALCKSWSIQSAVVKWNNSGKGGE